MEKGIEPLVDALYRIDNKADMVHFLEEILTSTERHDLGLRWELMKQLREGKTQRAIAQDLHVSLCKVTRGNKILKKKDSVSGRLLGEQDEQ